MVSKKKLYLVTDLYWPFRGGQEEWVRALAAAMRSSFEVTVVAHSCHGSYLASLLHQTALSRPFTPFNDPGGTLVIPLKPAFSGRLIMLAFLVWYVPLLRRIFPAVLYDWLYRFYRLAYHHRLAALLRDANIVHCVSTKYLARLTATVCAAQNIPLVQAPPVHFGEWGDSPAQLRAYVAAQVVNCPTVTFKDELGKRVKASDCTFEIVRPLSVPPGDAEAIGSLIDQPFIFFLGRKVAYKGLADTINAFSRIASGVRLVIAGPGSTVHHSDSRIIDLGEVTDNQKTWLLQQCLFLCVPSRSESFGLVYVEAMREGKAVVACAVSPVNEIVIDRDTGLLVEAGDTDSLKRSLERLIEDAEYRATLGLNGLNRYRQYYSDTRAVERLMAIYSRLTGAVIPR